MLVFYNQTARLETLKRLYLFAALIGATAPYATYFGYLAGVPGSSSALSLAWGNPIAAATLVDFAIASLAFWPFVFSESARLGMRFPWFFVLTNLLVGLSFALPAFLYARECKLAQK